MAKSRLSFFSLISILNYCVFTTILITTTTDLASSQIYRPDQTETLKRFKNEFALSSNCINDEASFFNGVVCDNSTGLVTVLNLPSGCLRGTLRPNSSLFELRNLRQLNLSYNNFASSSSLPSSFSQLNNLEVLFLSSNGFIGQVPSSLRNLTNLSQLTLSHNKLNGNLEFLQNLTNLVALDLSYNQYFGTIPSYLFTMPFLNYLDLSENHFTGSIELKPSNYSSSKLEVLLLGNNHLDVEIIEQVLKLVNLQYLGLSFLNTSLPIELSVFSSLKSLSYLVLIDNDLTPTSVNSDIVFPNMKILTLSRCNISEFPRFLKSLKMLEYLDLSNNRIKGNVPVWLWRLPSLAALSLVNNSFTGFEGSLDNILVHTSLQILDLALNSFKGSFPNPPLSVINLSAWNNSFTGEIPLSICNRTFLDVLDLSYNNFTGSIPPCMGNFTIVNLRRNKLEGNIPDKFYSGATTQTFDVGYNRLTGKLPRSLLNCSLLKFLSVDHNGIDDTFPFWLKALPNLKVLTLRSNRFHGPISQPNDEGPLAFPKLQIFEISHNMFTGSLPTNYFANWSATSLKMADEDRLYMGDFTSSQYTYDDTLDLQYKGLYMEQGKVLTFYAAIDFSGNKLEGQIPESIGLLKSLIALNLSNNSFSGYIPMSFANVTELGSLDLSRNNLLGEIPQELGKLTFLAYMDLSDNQLTGEIPHGPQIRGFPKSSFEGNTGLCGLPLESCLSEKTPSTQDPEDEEEEEQVLNWKGVAIAYGPSVLLGLAIGHVVALYKPEWFIKSSSHNKFRRITKLYD